MDNTRPDRWRVVVIEDDNATRAHLCHGVSAARGALLAAEFSLLEPARAWLSEHEADLLLTDLSLPDGHALGLIREVKRRHPSCEIVVVSVFGDEETVLACIQNGATGYVHKDASPADIGSTIRQLREGGSPISPMIARKVLTRLQAGMVTAAEKSAPSNSRLRSPTVPALSRRETEVLQLIAKGYSYGEAAKLLGLGLTTVQTHVRGIYAKLEVHSRGEAVFEASRIGLLDGWAR
jgi:DNA-binding NarL/FixJ family response regulator